MQKIIISGLVAASLSGCGASLYDRSISGVGIGAGASLLVQGDPLWGAALGLAVGALVNEDTFSLGDPIW